MSDDFGMDDDDTEFLAAATQIGASQADGDEFPGSPRLAKRRRLDSRREGRSKPSDDDKHHDGIDTTQPVTQATAAAEGIDEPGVDPARYAPREPGEQQGLAKNPKYRIHISKNGGKLPGVIFTQTQVGIDSSPSRLRGAIWKQPKPSLPPPVNETSNGCAPSSSSDGIRQTTLNSIAPPRGKRKDGHDDAAYAARLQAEEDAFAVDLGLRQAAPPPSNLPPPSQLHEELADLPSDAFASSSSPEKSPTKDVVDITSSRPTSRLPAQGLRAPRTGLKQLTIFGKAATQDLTASQAANKRHAWPTKDREEAPTHHRLDEDAMKTWMYPTNLGTVRDYQYNIVSRSLFHNTLVALPTGLGKTFIAATVMLNYYRWTTNAQTIFMAPTKPLIAQQMEACYHVAGISRHDTVLMTGETTPAIRADEWAEKRVFFMTPQTVINDLKTGICDPKKIVLLVVDEAHKATGNYAYTEVVSFLHRFNNSFRVLALTATPGSSVEAVQAVIDNLGIARVELRTEQSLDIRPYTHEKKTDEELFDYSDEQHLIMDLIGNAIRPILQKLNIQNAYWSKDPMALSAYGLTQARQRWSSSDAGRKAPMPVKGMVQSCFTVLSQLAHSIGLLKFHGIGPFYSGMKEFQRNVESGRTKSKNAREVVQSNDWVQMTNRIDGWLGNPDFVGHPKLQYLREVVLNHFLDAGEGTLGIDAPPSATRVMVFASYRDSTEEICRVLKRSEPMIRPQVFVGQASSSTSEGMNQKRQNEVIQDFRAGKFNTLIATSIGEEGLDIGDVDLIVCYDASSSPIRMLQRIGRTGRKRLGRVVLLLMKDKEERDYAKAQDNYQYIQKSIADESKYNYRDDQSPRILPKEARPVVDKRVINIPIENSQPVDLNEKRRRSNGKRKQTKPAKRFNMPDNVRTGFVKASKLASDDGSEEPVPKARNAACCKQATAGLKTRAPSPPPEAVQLPYLGDVILTTVEEREHERKYAHSASASDVMVRAPDPGAHAAALRDIGPSKYIGRGRSLLVSQAMHAVQEVGNDQVARMKAALDQEQLISYGEARGRLVSPGVEQSEDDLPLPVPKVVKPKRKPRKTKPQLRAASYGYAVMEGDDSEPEPTPADMRIGTQGIDLGSRDTSGEDEEDQPDSDDQAFIAGSDEPLQHDTTSQSAMQEVTPQKLRKTSHVLRHAGGIRPVAELSHAPKEDGGDGGIQATAGVAISRKKRVIDDSESE